MLLHVITADGWAEVKRAGRLSAAPFLHLCTAAQLPFVLERFFAGQAGLLVLRISPAGLDVRWEVSEAGMDPFPHLYGAAPVSAVVSVEPVSVVAVRGEADAGAGQP